MVESRSKSEIVPAMKRSGCVFTGASPDRRAWLLLRLDLHLHVEELIVLALEVPGNLADEDAGGRFREGVGVADGVAAENEVVVIAADDDAPLGGRAVVQDAVV